MKYDVCVYLSISIHLMKSGWCEAGADLLYSADLLYLIARRRCRLL